MLILLFIREMCMHLNWQPEHLFFSLANFSCFFYNQNTVIMSIQCIHFLRIKNHFWISFLFALSFGEWTNGKCVCMQQCNSYFQHHFLSSMHKITQEFYVVSFSFTELIIWNEMGAKCSCFCIFISFRFERNHFWPWSCLNPKGKQSLRLCVVLLRVFHSNAFA